MAASLAGVVIGIPLAAHVLSFSPLAEPERAPEAVGDGGAVLLGERPGILGHGDLGDGEHRSRSIEQQLGELRHGALPELARLLFYAPGPALAVAKVAVTNDPWALPEKDGAAIAYRFRRALGLGEG